MPEQYANAASSTLSGGLTAGATTLVVASAAAFPTAGNFRILIDAELLLVTLVSGTTFTVTRGVEGTAAAAHNNLAAVTHVLTAASVQAVATNPIGAIATRGQGQYYAVHFDDKDSSLYLVSSDDGINWGRVNRDALYAGVRDPSLFYDGTNYYVAFTRQNTPFYKWSIIKSPDLATWTSVADIDESGISQAGGAVTLAWGPEWFVDSDGTVHVVVALGHASTTMQLYETHPTTPGVYTAWSTAVPLAGTALPADMIDPFVIKSGVTYYVFYKNDTNKYYEVMTSTSLTSGYVVQGSAHWMTNWPAVSGNGWEGWSMAQVDSNTWYAWVDNTDVSDNGLGYQYSVYTGAPGAGWIVGGNWSAPANTSDPFVKRHGTVLRVQDVMEMRNLTALAQQSMRTKGTTVTSGAIVVANNTGTAMTFNTVVIDELGAWNAGSPTKLTVPTTGWYHISEHSNFGANTSGKRVMDARINGSNYISSTSSTDNSATGANGVDLAQAPSYYLHAGDYVELTVFQNSGSTNSVTASLSLVRLP